MEKTSLKSYIGRYFSDKFIRKHGFYLQKGYEDAYATAKVAQDIILSKITKSNYRNNIRSSNV